MLHDDITNIFNKINCLRILICKEDCSKCNYYSIFDGCYFDNIMYALMIFNVQLEKIEEDLNKLECKE